MANEGEIPITVQLLLAFKPPGPSYCLPAKRKDVKRIMTSATFQRLAISKSTVTVSGRRYMISPGDISKAILWPPGTSVEVEETDDPVYRVVIRRLDYPNDELRANLL
jgi:hypothetical protein